MAIKRIVPVQDTFIVQDLETNYGLDEILEIGQSSEGALSRALIQFPTNQLEEALYLASGSDFRANLHFYVSEVRNLPPSFSLVLTPVLEGWKEGLGTVGDSAEAGLTGATWNYRDDEGHRWEVPGAFSENICVENIYLKDFKVDIDLDLTDTIEAWSSGSGSIDSCSFELRFKNEEEAVTWGSNISLYSGNTNTIYRPYLEVSWDDSIRDIPESSSLQECTNIFGIFSSNLREEYTVGDFVRIDLEAKSRYPERCWSTESIYRQQYILPETSCWGIKDEYTNDMIIDFSAATKISADEQGSFFMLDTSNLEPERYYRLLVEVDDGIQRAVIDNKNIFRVGRNGRSF